MCFKTDDGCQSLVPEPSHGHRTNPHRSVLDVEESHIASSILESEAPINPAKVQTFPEASEKEKRTTAS